MSAEHDLLLLPKLERDFVKFVKKSKQIGNAGNEDYERLVNLLKQWPYPMLAILQRMLAISKLNIQVMNVMRTALEQLLAACEDNDVNDVLTLICFIAQFPVHLLEAATLRKKFIETIALLLHHGHDKLYLALFARIDAPLVLDIIGEVSHGNRNTSNHYSASYSFLPTKQDVFIQAVLQQKHFTNAMCNELQWQTITNITDAAVRNNMIALKLINAFENALKYVADVSNLDKWLDSFVVDDSPEDLRRIHQFIYADVQRIWAIMRFLQQQSGATQRVSVDALLQSSTVLELLSQHDIKMPYQDTRQLIDAAHMWRRRADVAASKHIHELELQTLTCYTALSLVVDVLLANADDLSQSSDLYANKTAELHSLLRQLHNLDVLCSVMEDLLQLVFVRWENLRVSEHQVQSPCVVVSNTRTDTSCADISNSSGDDSPAPVQHYAQHGFVCRPDALQSIFTQLKKFVTRKFHSADYKDAPEHSQLRFQRIVDAINMALWKYSVLEKIDKSFARSGIQQKPGGQCQLRADELQQLVQLHVDIVDKSSSDDEGRAGSGLVRSDRNYHSLVRRKTQTKKRRRATFSGSMSEQPKPIVAINATGQRYEPNQTRLRSPSVTERSIVPKMLASPECLAHMALGLHQLDAVKYIIDTFSLQNDELENELSFLEQQQHVKQKLATIYANYACAEQERTEQRRDDQRPQATVEQIKQVAAKGFEVSKLISVVDNFAKVQRVEQTAHVKRLLQRYAGHAQYGACLRQFEECHLNAVVICDLILHLPLDREITANIVMVIKRQQQMAGGIVLSTGTGSARSATTASHCANETSTRSSAAPMPLRDIGSMQLLEYLAECLRLLPEPHSLAQLLSDSYYPLKPRRLTATLQRQRAFDAVFYQPHAALARVDQLRAHAPLFHALQSKSPYYARFHAYVAHLARLLQIRDRHLEYHTHELLQRDAYVVVGELLFECDVTPAQLEPHVGALNLNLLHVLAVNVCPALAPQRRWSCLPAPPKAQAAVVDFIAKQNHLLAYLLRCVMDNGVAASTPNGGRELDVAYLRNAADVPGMKQLSALYARNRIVSTLYADVAPSQQLCDLHLQPLEQLELMLLQLGNRERERDCNATMAAQWPVDRLVIALIAADNRHIELAAHIRGDIRKRAAFIQAHFTRITTTRLAKELIEQTLRHRRAVELVPAALRAQLKATLADITVYARVSEVMQFETWPQAYDFGQRTPSIIFHRLLQLQLYRLCYEWCDVVQLATRFTAQNRVFLDALAGALLQSNDDTAPYNAGQHAEPAESDPTMLLRILETFAVDERIAFLDAHKERFRSLTVLAYAIDFLTQHSRTDATVNAVNAYHNYRISLIIFGQLSLIERSHFWPIIRFPLLIVEQLVMNAKFELLSKVLTAVRQALGEHTPIVCAFCYDKRGGNIYNIHTNANASSGHTSDPMAATALSHTLSSNSAFILLNFNLYQPDHMLSAECIDLLLRIYATKALDYHIADGGQSSWEQISQSTDARNSLDSLCDAFRMPRVTPTRDDWVRDEEATHCMCCRRAKFTMLMRRHHCRRCGRVVCFACSAHRQRIADSVYEQLPVRVCNDCHRHIEDEELSAKASPAATAETTAKREQLRRSRWAATGEAAFKWNLSGNITHDKLLREEFCYEHAPSVALCLSILDHHAGNEKCIDLLLYHCRQLERLIVPNPEVDYELVSKMMKCLALAAKVRGGPAETESICEHAEIIESVVQHGCEALIPPGLLSLRKLADSLVEAEKWSLALKVHLKFGFHTAGVMAAHGLAGLRAGCFDMAREKFTHCMPKLSTELTNAKLLMCLQKPPQSDLETLPPVKRPQRGPPLLQEIVKLVESMAPFATPQEEALKRASLIRSSNTSLATLLPRQRREPHMLPSLHEPALNVLNTLANLKHIAKGQYKIDVTATANTVGLDNRKASTAPVPTMQTKDFTECMHYLLTYGSHADILGFLVERNQTIAALQYVHAQQLDAELFIYHLYLPALRCGRVPLLLDAMLQFDARLLCWRQEILHTCRYLEQKQLLNSLYQLQLLLNDPVRASMTCVRFYTMHCDNFHELHANAEHLHNAQRHLQSELDVTKWANINVDDMPAVVGGGRGRRKSSYSAGAAAAGSRRSSSDAAATGGLLMQMDARALNGHINTIVRQLEVAKFLSYCERRQGADECALITERILKQIRLDTNRNTLPTLFDGVHERIQICILLLLCGTNIEDGYGLAYRIIEAYKLPTIKVFGATARYLARNQRVGEVEKLVNCIGSNNNGNGCISDVREMDELLSIAINSACNNHETNVKVTLDNLIKRMHSIELRISSHIFIGQLKSAYLLANKYERLSDIKRILREAERTNQTHIKKLCEKKLCISSSSVNVNVNANSTATNL